MRRLTRYASAAAATALFAVLVCMIFRGAWGLDSCPVMPDARTVWPESGAAMMLRDWLACGLFHPLDVRFFAGSPYFWQELFFALCAWLSGAGMAYWLRGRGVSRLSSCAAGLLLSLCGYWFTLYSAGHAGWFYWMSTGTFSFGLMDRAVRKNKMKNWVLLGACEAWASFHQPDLWLVFAVFAGAYFAWCCVRERKWPCIKGLAACAAVFFAVGAPSFANALGEAIGARDRQVDKFAGAAAASGADAAEARWIFATNWSMPPAETAEFAFARINGDTSCPLTLALGARQGTGVRPYTGALGRPYGAKEGNYRQHSLYVGLATCLLALAGAACAFRRKRGGSAGDAGFLAAAAAVFWLFSLGRYCEPVYRLVYALPFGDYLRAPVKWHHLTEFCLCALAGYGLDLLRRAAGAKMPRLAAASLAAVVAFAGAMDLARVDRLYCAVDSIAPFRAPNAAAAEIVRRGGGTMLDLVSAAGGPLADSFRSQGVDVTGGGAADVEHARFVLAAGAPGAPDALDPAQASWLAARGASCAGAYALTARGVRKAFPGARGVFSLWEVPGVEPPDRSPKPSTVALGALSLAAGVFAAAFGAAKS